MPFCLCFDVTAAFTVAVGFGPGTLLFNGVCVGLVVCSGSCVGSAGCSGFTVGIIVAFGFSGVSVTTGFSVASGASVTTGVSVASGVALGLLLTAGVTLGLLLASELCVGLAVCSGSFVGLVVCSGFFVGITGCSDSCTKRTITSFKILLFCVFTSATVTNSSSNGSLKNNNVYSIDYNDATIITLDSNRDPWFLFSQREWLEKTLKASKKKWKIVMLHHPVYSIKGKTNNLAVRWMFDGLFREYGVDLVLQGHEHNYARMTNKNDEGEMTTPLYLVSHASPKSYRLSFNDKYDRFGTNRRFYQHIDVTGDTLRMQAYLENDSLYDDVRIVKNASGTQIIDNAKDIPEILEMPARLSGKKAEEFERNAEKWRNRSLIK